MSCLTKRKFWGETVNGEQVACCEWPDGNLYKGPFNPLSERGLQLDAITAFAAWVDGASLKMTDTHRCLFQAYQHERWYPSVTQVISRLPADFGVTVKCVPAFAYDWQPSGYVEAEPKTDKERFLELCRELFEHCSMRDDGDLEEVELLMRFDPDAAFCLQSLHRAEDRLAGYLKSRLEKL